MGGEKDGPGGRKRVGLTTDVADTIVSYIRAGAFDFVAAEAAGISERTFRDWMARGEGRGPRAGTPELRAFAAKVRQARAEARIGAETRVFRDRPTYWLARVARTKTEREGWDEPGRSGMGIDAVVAPSNMSDEKLQEEIIRFYSMDIESRRLRVPPCSRPRCRCEYHRPVPPRPPRPPLPRGPAWATPQGTDEEESEGD